MRANPHLFEVNAFRLLRRLSEQYEKPLTLSTIPEKEWKSLRARGFDIVWAMGVWKRSPGARQKALNEPVLRNAYVQTLPDWSEKDVTGSPYAVYDYSLDPFLGREGELRELKERLNRLGLKLMLDFVPNHLALDHPWTLSHPEYFISAPPRVSFPHAFRRESTSGSSTKPFEDDFGNQFFEAGPGVFLAHGRDPSFPPWNDTVQVNYFSSAAREAMIGELLRISEVSDGVRCDMAMLLISTIFKKNWEAVAHEPKQAGEFWQKALDCIRRKNRDFIFMAEAYWNTEWQLQQMGFDFTYDKTLYDRLLHSNAADVRGHLRAEAEYQKRSVRFIENHDENRAATAFGPERSLAAVVVSSTVPGLRFFHDGQQDGLKIHTPIQLGRECQEKGQSESRKFYDRLLKTIDAPAFHEGNWKLLAVNPAGENNSTHSNLLAWSWEMGAEMSLVVVNDSPVRSRGLVKLPRTIRGAQKISFRDGLCDQKYSYAAEEINGRGIYVELEPWKAHIMEGPVLEKEVKP